LNDQGEDNPRVDPKKYIAYGSKEWEKAKEGVMYVKQYRPNVATYALPDYIGAVNAIITDAEIANFHRAAIQNGFQGGTMIVFKNGQPSDEEMATIERQIKKKFTGTDRANTFVIDFVDDPTRTPEIIPLNGNDFDKRYDALNDTIQQEIFVGHKVTSPMLFGVRVEGQLGGRNEMATAYSLFQNTYITPKQLLIEAVLNELVGLNNRLTIKPVEPILPDFSEQTLLQILTKDEMREIIGRKPLKVEQPAATGFCKHTFAKDDDLKDLEVFSKFGRSSDDYMSVKNVKAMFSVQEMDGVQHQMFALTKTEKAILDLLKTSPDASAKDVAKYLKITEKEATDIMTNLLDKGYLDENLKLTNKGAETKTPDLTELVVMYKYELRANAPDLVAGGQSRPFCKGMMSANKLYTREEIDQIGKELGNIYGEPNYDVFRRRGGWYTDPNTGVHQPACRHIWMQGIYKKR
jgi:DNA-binding CsgD family transcriptional regulator